MRYPVCVISLLSLCAISSCKKETQPGNTATITLHEVDTVCGTYYGMKHRYHSFTSRSSGTKTIWLDTTYADTVMVKKMSPNSFKMYNNISMYSTTFLYGETSYKGLVYDADPARLEFFPTNDSMAIRSYLVRSGGNGDEVYRDSFTGRIR